MPIGARLLICAVIVLAAFLVTHVALLVRVLGVTGITTRERAWMLVPFVTPYAAWKSGKRRHVVLWSCLIVLYLGLRVGLAYVDTEGASP